MFTITRTPVGVSALAVSFSFLAAACSPVEAASESPDAPARATPQSDAPVATSDPVAAGSYAIVDTGQAATYGTVTDVLAPAAGELYFGQDAQHDGNQPSYNDNGDGTITDNVTGLTWTQTPDLNSDGTIDARDKLTFAEAIASADAVNVGDYDDWRLPTVKELYSLILFAGEDVGNGSANANGYIPFIDADYFDFGYGDLSAGDRIIDAQVASSTTYVDTAGPPLMFGLNYADGRIKGYPTEAMPHEAEAKGYYVYYVRGNPDYGMNAFADNGDGTVTDAATSLMWAQNDSGSGMNWEDALAHAEEANATAYLGFTDWRVPNAKELQSIVDYSRSPGTSGSAAIDPVFNTTAITSEAGQQDYAMYWTSTTLLSPSGPRPAGAAVYIAFGSALGYMNGRWVDVHGAGAQRSDPKVGDAADYPEGHGPQGDAIRIENMVRLVRDAS